MLYHLIPKLHPRDGPSGGVANNSKKWLSSSVGGGLALYVQSPGFGLHHRMKPGVAAPTCDLSSLEVEAGEAKDGGPPLFHGELNACLRCVGFCLKRKKQLV